MSHGRGAGKIGRNEAEGEGTCRDWMRSGMAFRSRHMSGVRT